MVASNRWKMSDSARHGTALIGPNAILQTIPVLDQLLGQDGCGRLLERAGIIKIPDGQSMIPEHLAANLHRQLRQDAPQLSRQAAERAGLATANYILANRIPKPAQTVLRLLPAGLSAKVLSRAIHRHAWTFVGSGRFDVVDPWCFEIHNNPLIRGEKHPACLCHWHTAVFARLFQVLVAGNCTCHETVCAAQGHQDVCRFELFRRAN